MSPVETGATPPRNQPPMPSYFRKDRTGRDEFLSQLGHFSEEHRALFNRLCDFWEPDLSYSKFFAKAGQEFLNTESSLASLMAHMESGHCGLITKAWREGVLERDRLILTDRDDRRFWYWLIENEWQACRASDRQPFPTVASFKDRGGLPAAELQPLSLAEISSSFIAAHRDEVVLYTLPDIEGAKLVATPAALPLMMDVARLKIRDGLTDSPLLPVLARLLGTVVSDLLRALSSADDAFWNRLAEAMTVHREDLLAKRASLPLDLFVAAKILKAYTRNEMDEAEHRREEEAEKRETIAVVLDQISKKEDFLVTPAELDGMFSPYKDSWPDLKEMFFSHYMRPTGRTGLPSVVMIVSDYIFRDHLFPLFRLRHKEASLELRDHYMDLMERLLRTNNRDRITAFTSREAFREDVKDRLAEEFPVLADMLTKPRLVSEGLIHYATKVLRIADMERVKDIMARYFENGTVRFKAPELLFDLPLGDMFAETFRRLTFVRRILLKLLGRYESYLQVIDQAGKPPAASAKGAGSPGSRIDDFDAPEPMNRPYRTRPFLREEEAVPFRRKKDGEHRRYSSKQQEEAWNQFRDAAQKKGGRK